MVPSTNTPPSRQWHLEGVNGLPTNTPLSQQWQLEGDNGPTLPTPPPSRQWHLEGVNGRRTILLVLASVNGSRGDTLEQQVLLYQVHVLLFLSENKHRRRRPVQHGQDVGHASLLG